MSTATRPAAPRVFVAQGAWVEQALQKLYASLPARECRRRIALVLREVARGQFTLDNLLVAAVEERILGVLLGITRPGREALVFPPWVSHEGLVLPVCQALFGLLAQRLDQAGVVFSQCLLAHDDAAGAGVLQACGMPRVAQLNLLRAALPARRRQPAVASAIASIPSSSMRSADFARLIEATYRGTLDCPAVSRFRSGDDTLAAHWARDGASDDLARIYLIDGQARGVLLMTADDQSQTAEIAYVGVIPTHRGRGVGRLMVGDALRWAVQAGCRNLDVAVDAANLPAARLYASAGFAEYDRVCLHARVSPACPPLRD